MVNEDGWATQGENHANCERHMPDIEAWIAMSMALIAQTGNPSTKGEMNQDQARLKHKRDDTLSQGH